MSYASRNLSDGERIIYSASIHYLIFLPAIIYAGVAVACYGFAKSAPGSTAVFAWVAAAGFGLFALRHGLASIITYLTTECVLTNRRVIAKRGLIRRDATELLLAKVEGVRVDQGILGRLFNFGTITVSGTGGSFSPFAGIAAPMKFRGRVQEQIASMQMQRA